MIKWALVFKDSISGTEEPGKLSDCHTNCTCLHQSKDQPLPAVREEVPRTFNPEQISVPL
jgi:hypothetical protein